MTHVGVCKEESMSRKVSKQKAPAKTVTPEVPAAADSSAAEDTKVGVSTAKKAKKAKKVKAPKPPKQKKEKRSAKRQREAYEKAIKKGSAEKTLSLIAVGLAVLSSVLQVIIDNVNDKKKAGDKTSDGTTE